MEDKKVKKIKLSDYPEGWEKVKKEKLAFLKTDEEREAFLISFAIDTLNQL